VKTEMREGRPLVPPMATVRLNTPPNAKQSAAIPKKAETPKPITSKAKPDRPIRMFFCAGCGIRAEGYNVPAGWVTLKRIDARGSRLPPPAIRDQAKAVRRWLLRPPEHSLGLYCSVTCLPADQARLTEVERDLNARGVGLKPLDELQELIL
jgi:hypothetical protein